MPLSYDHTKKTKSIYPQSLPDIENREEVYEVEQILKHRRGHGYE